MKRYFNAKIILSFILGAIIFSCISVYAAVVILSKDVTYDNTKSKVESTNVQDAIDELYEKIDNGKCVPNTFNGDVEANGWVATYTNGLMTSCKYGTYKACKDSSCSENGLDGCTGNSSTEYYYEYRTETGTACVGSAAFDKYNENGIYVGSETYGSMAQCTSAAWSYDTSGGWSVSACHCLGVTASTYSDYYKAPGAGLSEYFGG